MSVVKETTKLTDEERKEKQREYRRNYYKNYRITHPESFERQKARSSRYKCEKYQNDEEYRKKINEKCRVRKAIREVEIKEKLSELEKIKEMMGHFVKK